MMKICVINIDFTPAHIGGIKRVSTILAREWCRLGHNIIFITDCPDDRRTNINGIDDLVAEYPDKIQSIFLPNNSDKAEFLISVIKNQGIDILLNQHGEENVATDICAEAAKSTGVKLVTSWHFAPTTFIDEKDAYFVKARYNKGLKSIFLASKWLLWGKRHEANYYSNKFRFIENSSDKFVLLSDKFIPDTNKLLGYPSNKLCAINNPTVFGSEHTLNSEKENIVVWCGRVGMGFKRIDLMLDIWNKVFRKHPGWKCVIMGGGDIDFWSKKANEKGLRNIEFTGFCNPKEYYRKAKIYCMTSTTEGWGLVLIEAMSYKCVPLAFNSYASLTDIIQDGINGYAIKPFDINDYSDTLSNLMDNEIQREQLANNCKDLVSKFPPRNIAKQWIDLFNDII